MRSLASIILLLVVACGSQVPTVESTHIAVPSGTHYCLKIEVGKKRTPVVTCTPNKKLCEWGYGRIQKFGYLSDVKSVTTCYPQPAYVVR